MGILNRPFEHIELDYKQNLVIFARELRQRTDIEALLAAVMIYSSICEYVSKHLLESLKHQLYHSTYRDHAGILFIDLRNTTDKKTINNVADELQKYGFPDKVEIIELMRRIGENRNMVVHRLATTEKKNLNKLDDAIYALLDDSEALIAKMDTLYVGFEKIFQPTPGIQKDIEESVSSAEVEVSSNKTKMNERKAKA